MLTRAKVSLTQATRLLNCLTVSAVMKIKASRMRYGDIIKLRESSKTVATIQLGKLNSKTRVMTSGTVTTQQIHG